jgi:ferredoxin
MIASSRRTRRMDHCITWCPIGLVATTLGRLLSPWRMRLAPGCDGCGSCAVVCRYDALRPEHIRSGRPGPSCTLCGDCLRACKGRFVEYRLPGLGPDASRAVFLVLVSSLHAVFLGVARI